MLNFDELVKSRKYVIASPPERSGGRSNLMDYNCIIRQSVLADFRRNDNIAMILKNSKVSIPDYEVQRLETVRLWENI